MSVCRGKLIAKTFWGSHAYVYKGIGACLAGPALAGPLFNHLHKKIGNDRCCNSTIKSLHQNPMSHFAHVFMLPMLLISFN